MKAKSSYQQEKRQIRGGVKAAIRSHKSGNMNRRHLRIIASEAMSWEITKSFEEKSERKMSKNR